MVTKLPTQCPPLPALARPVPDFLRRALPESARCPIFLDGHARICPVPDF